VDGEDIEHSIAETRRLRLARSAAINLLVVVYTVRSHGHEKNIRIISARLANRMKKGAIKRRKIDYSDIPPLSKSQLASMRRIGRPPLGDEPRQLIAIRLDVKVLRWLKAIAAERRVPYQSLINDLLANEMKKVS
jgi:uncharacterized protein (DUF4415 family)